MCIALPFVLAMLLHWSSNSQFLGHCRILMGTEAGTGDAASTGIILAAEQVMLKHSVGTDNGRHSELSTMIAVTG